MSSRIDRELAEAEAREAERKRQAEQLPAKKRGIGGAIKRVAKDAMVRRTSTKR